MNPNDAVNVGVARDAKVVRVRHRGVRSGRLHRRDRGAGQASNTTEAAHGSARPVGTSFPASDGAYRTSGSAPQPVQYTSIQHEPSNAVPACAEPSVMAWPGNAVANSTSASGCAAPATSALAGAEMCRARSESFESSVHDYSDGGAVDGEGGNVSKKRRRHRVRPCSIGSAVLRCRPLNFGDRVFVLCYGVLYASEESKAKAEGLC